MAINVLVNKISLAIRISRLKEDFKIEIYSVHHITFTQNNYNIFNTNTFL